MDEVNLIMANVPLRHEETGLTKAQKEVAVDETAMFFSTALNLTCFRLIASEELEGHYL